MSLGSCANHTRNFETTWKVALRSALDEAEAQRAYCSARRALQILLVAGASGSAARKSASFFAQLLDFPRASPAFPSLATLTHRQLGHVFVRRVPQRNSKPTSLAEH